MKNTIAIITGLLLIHTFALGQVSSHPESRQGYKKARLEGISFSDFFTERTQYPINAVRYNIEGIVVLSFEIDSVGNIDKIEMLENPNSLLSLEAVLSLQKSEGLWQPAQLNGSNINESYIAVYSFLNKSTKEKYDVNLNRATKYLKQEKYDKAQKSITQARKINAYDPKLYQIESVIYEKSGKPTLAEKSIDMIKYLNNNILFNVDLYIYTVVRTRTIK